MIAVLFGAIRGGVIKPLEIPSTQRARLLQQNDPALRKEAETAFREFEGADRMQVYRTYRDVVKNEADVAAGRPVFVRVCSACRTCNDAGGKAGPDLTGLRNQPAETLLLHIMVPNFEITRGIRRFPPPCRMGVTSRAGSWRRATAASPCAPWAGPMKPGCAPTSPHLPPRRSR